VSLRNSVLDMGPSSMSQEEVLLRDISRYIVKYIGIIRCGRTYPNITYCLHSFAVDVVRCSAAQRARRTSAFEV